MKRCAWAETNDLFIPYHDKEWGAPQHNEQHLFEMLTLEGAQAGLSWLTILRRRDSYRVAFAGFDPKLVAAFGAADRGRLLADSGIIRNRLKIDATISNAQQFLAVQAEVGSFNTFLWTFTGGQTIVDGITNGGVGISETMSKTLKQRGFRFVGPTICYALMQATGMINDHEPGCFKHVS